MKRIAALAIYLLFSILFVLASSSAAQGPATGTPPFSSIGGGPFDAVNLGNLNVHFAVPIVHKAGRGVPFNYDLTYESSIYQIAIVSGAQMWQPVQLANNVVSYWGWQFLGPVVSPYVSYSMTQTTLQCFVFPSATLSPYTSIEYTNFAYHDPSGATHPFSTSFQVISGAPANQSGGDCPANGTQPSSAQTASAYDSSGYVLTVQPPNGGSAIGGLAFRDGTIISVPFLTSPPNTSSPYAVTDANGNKISLNNGVYTDTLGTSVLTAAGTHPSPTTFTYTSPVGSKQYTVNYSSFNIRTSFGCSVHEYSANNVSLVSSIVLPDLSEYVFSYELTPGSTTTYTGRVSQVTLPTGGTISYTYTGSNDGINCADGTTVGLTRALSPGGQWQYSRTGSGTDWTTTVQDPGGNQTAISFEELNSNFYETQRLAYQGTTSGTLLSTSINCYNLQSVGTPSACFNTHITAQITRVTNFEYLPNASGVQKETDSTYDQFGLIHEVDEYDYGQAAVGSLIRKTITNYAALGNNIADRPSSVYIADSGNNAKALTTYGYDESALATPSGTTPQWVSITGSRGNLTTVTAQANASTSLYRKYTYYKTGMLSTSTDVSTSSTTNGATTTYNYSITGNADCGNSFVTSISEPVASMSRSFTWDCNGGVLLSVLDENGKTSSTAYNGTGNVFWRPSSTTDEAGTVTTYSYNLTTSTPPVEFQTESASATFNVGNSIVDKVTTNDGFGRSVFSQTRQGPAASNYDTVATCYDTSGRVSLTTLPYSAALATSTSTCPSTNAGTVVSYDALGRTSSTGDNFVGGGSTAFSYHENDTLETRTSPTVSKQSEFDGLGRVSSVCEITSGTTAWPSAACNPPQNTGATGYLTKYTHDLLGNIISVAQNAQTATNNQSRTYVFDMLGRLTSETNPEMNNTAVTYAYDSLTSDAACGTITSAGNLLKRLDAAGNASCYSSYDALHRVGVVTYPSSTTPAKHFVYDTATVNSVAMLNAKTRMAEAYTCIGGCASKLTDLGFSYDAVGRQTDFYESTPDSVAYYHVAATYWPNSQLNTLSGVSLPTITYGVNGEGLPNTVSASTGVNPVSATTYNPAARVTDLTFGSGDPVHFAYDTNTGRMTQYKLTINGTAVSGNPAWNSNGTLQQVPITDPFNASDAQTCNYGYDAMARVASVDCGASHWQQNFAYDPFGNVTKTVPTGGTGTSFNPGYDLKNRYTSIGTYDANGNLTNDGTDHTYAWDADGHPITLDTRSMIYDALGREVELQNAGTNTEFVYGPTGKLALMNGQTQAKAYIQLPGGTQVKYIGSAISTYRLPDWLGSLRVGSNPNRTYSWGVAFGPFGEQYASSGSPALSFTGEEGTADSITDEYDFLARKLHSAQGRWISPDPAGLAATNPSDPQTWNRYAYVGNRPTATIDPFGLDDFSNDFSNIPSDCFFNITVCATTPGSEEYAYCVFVGLCLPDPDEGGGGGGGGGGTSAPPQRTGGVWSNNETLGLPSGLNAKVLGTGPLLGLLPNLGCGGGIGSATGFLSAGDSSTGSSPCAPGALYSFGNDFLQPCCAGGVCQRACRVPDRAEQIEIAILASLLYYGVKAVSAAECWNQYIRDLKACADAYPPGPERQECYNKSKAKRDFCLGKTTGPTQ